MRRRWVLTAAAGTGLASLGLTVLAWAGASHGYDWLAARCGALPEVYPELGWLFFLMPPAALGLLASGLALLLEARMKPGAHLFLAFAVLMVCAAAICVAVMGGSGCPTGL